MATCSRTFTLNVSDDMPLDQAVYVPSSGSHGAFIAGVRGGDITKFDANTGIKTSASTFRFIRFGYASVAYEPVSDKLVAVAKTDPNGEWIGTTGSTNRPLYIINPATLSVSTFDPISTPGWPLSAFQSEDSGPYRVFALESGEILVLYSDGVSQVRVTVFAFNPLTSVVRLYSGGGGTTQFVPSVFWSDFAFDALNTQAYGFGGFDTGSGTFQIVPIVLSTLSVATAPFHIGANVGAAYPAVACVTLGICRAGVKLYVATGSPTIFRCTTNIIAMNQASGFTDLTLPDSDAKPFNIKTSPYDGLIYCPGYSNGKIYVLDPASDTVVATKTGFDSPFDVVFTPTKKWAVQHGSAGLKEIT